jgi:L-seryl-tRNA(Ser) seleniumtransferase
VSKLTLAALEAVLALYRAPEFLSERLTTLRLLTRAAGEMQAQAARLAPRVREALGQDYEVGEATLMSQIGSGALPIEQLPSHGLAIRTSGGRRPSLARLESALRALPRPVLGRLKDKTLWLDLRCLEPADEAEFTGQLASLAPPGAGSRP